VNSIENTLAFYSHPLIVLNDHDTYSCSLMGSCTGIHYRNRYLLLCTRHQLQVLDGRSYEDVGLLDEDGQSFCSAGGIAHYQNHINESEINDLTVFDFTQPCRDRYNMKGCFLNLNAQPQENSDQAIALLVSGYPTTKQSYNLTEESRQLGFTRAQVICTVAGQEDQLSADPAILKILTLDPLKFNPDGMSGGAAFSFQLINRIAHANLAGIVVRAGSGNFFILRINQILQSIDSWLATK
jgi:hypothetical protein